MHACASMIRAQLRGNRDSKRWEHGVYSANTNAHAHTSTNTNANAHTNNIKREHKRITQTITCLLVGLLGCAVWVGSLRGRSPLIHIRGGEGGGGRSPPPGGCSWGPPLLFLGGGGGGGGGCGEFWGGVAPSRGPKKRGGGGFYKYIIVHTCIYKK